MKNITIITALFILMVSCNKEVIEPVTCYDIYATESTVKLSLPMTEPKYSEPYLVDQICDVEFDKLQYLYPDYDSIFGTPPDRYLFKIEYSFTK